MMSRAIPDTMDRDVVAAIDADLDVIEREEGVRVALAVESGSRAWGFPSPDSDYDCRFIYLRRAIDYLSLKAPRDVIERPLTPVFDVNGWDLRKALLLLLKGNAVLGEWLDSPIVYRGDAEFRAEMKALVVRVASRVQTLRHYHGVGSGQMRRYGEEAGAEVSLKRFLYALRPALCLDWLAERPEASTPPMTLQQLLAETHTPAAARSAIGELVARKAVTREMGQGAVAAPLRALVEGSLARGARLIGELERSSAGEEAARWAEADAFFLAALRRWTP